MAFDMMATTYKANTPQVKPREGCFAVMATNVGDDAVTVNDMILYPGVIGTSLGDSRTFGGHFGYEYRGIIRIAFAGVGANPAVEIVQEFVPDQQIQK